MRLGKKAAVTTAAGRSFENVLKSKAYFLSIGIWQLYTLLQYISTKKTALTEKTFHTLKPCLKSLASHSR